MSLPGNVVQLPQPPTKPTPLLPNHTHFIDPYVNIKLKNANNDDVSLRLSKKHPNPTVAWTSSIARHCRRGDLAAAATDFTRMRLSGVEPNHITFITLLSGCAHSPSKTLKFGASLHAYVHKFRLDRDHVMVGTALVDMYSKCGHVRPARFVFDEMCEKNLVSWNTMIDGYMRNGDLEEGIQLFDEMPERDAISWTAMIGGFVKKGEFEQALGLFHDLQVSGVEPDYVTVVSVLAACANLGLLGSGLWINRFVLGRDFKDNIRVNNSLIDMYSRCGCIEFASQIFEGMRKRSLVSWNSIIVGFAVNGHAEEALKYFDRMRTDGFEPDGVSFTGALTACSHAGLVEEGLRYFDDMKRVYRISPRIEHYGCIVDLYSRAGRLEDAMCIIQMMPMKPNEVVLGSLMAACRTHGDVSLAERLMKYLTKLEPDCDSNYVLLSNTYAAVGKWNGAGKVREKMKALGIQKTPGCSSIEIDGCVHNFVAGDKSHVDADYIYEMLGHLSNQLNRIGYEPEIMAEETGETENVAE